ncbi:hypothetical protein KCP77_09070 [Salmonella enterica subsp. enterica]|nr:hypothetical protein KCP77_09070 [Salmonella enterica subsp. enterica]
MLNAYRFSPLQRLYRRHPYAIASGRKTARFSQTRGKGYSYPIEIISGNEEARLILYGRRRHASRKKAASW